MKRYIKSSDSADDSRFISILESHQFSADEISYMLDYIDRKVSAAVDAARLTPDDIADMLREHDYKNSEDYV